MRTLTLLLCLPLLGCNSSAAPDPAAAPVDSADVPYLRTRKTGSDWPAFLGPARTSVSPEKGILTPWPRQGLRVVWQQRVGAGYGMPSVSLGRLFQFDRHGDRARLTCMKS